MSGTIQFEDGEYGARAVVLSPWQNGMERQLLANGVKELELNHAKGWSGDNLDFLTALPQLKSFELIDLTINNVAPIHALTHLLRLKVITYCKTAIQFASFPQLQDCSIEWRTGAASIADAGHLKKLFVNSYTGSDLTLFSKLVLLEELAVLNAPITSLDGIQSLSELRALRLGNLKRLKSLAGIEQLAGLERLEVHTCPRIEAIAEVECLSRLRELHLINDGNIASLRPIDSIPYLDSVVFYESTNILDGDLGPLARQKHLQRVSFQNRRHYTHKREDFGVAYSR